MYGLIGVEIMKEIAELTRSEQSDPETQEPQKSPSPLTKIVGYIRHKADTSLTIDRDARLANNQLVSNTGCNE